MVSLHRFRRLRRRFAERELLVPVVGAFSAGKSSLLNAIMGSSILPMDIKPETAIPTELRHDTHERIEAFLPMGVPSNMASTSCQPCRPERNSSSSCACTSIARP